MAKTIRHRFLAGILVAALLCTAVPGTAYAVEGTEGTLQPVQKQGETGAGEADQNPGNGETLEEDKASGNEESPEGDEVSADGETAEGDKMPGDGADLGGDDTPGEGDTVEGEPMPGDENDSEEDKALEEQETEQPEDAETEETAGRVEESPEEMTAPLIQSEKASRAGGFVPRKTDPGNNSYYTVGNYYSGPANCTYYAWGRAHELLGYKPPFFGITGKNAKSWWDQPGGFEKGYTPRLGAIMCWGASDNNPFGHVAVVEEIHGNGKISFSEASNAPAYSFRYKENESISGLSNIYRGTFQGYIYLPGVGGEGQTEVSQEHGVYWEEGYYPVIPDGDYHIVSALGDQWWLTNSGFSMDDGGNVQLWQYDDMECDHHLYHFEFIPDGKGIGRGFYKITNKQSGKCLDSEGANEWLYNQNTGKRTNVQQWAYCGKGQEWAVNEIDGGERGMLYTFQSRCSGYYMDVEDAAAASGTNISMWKGNGSAAQQWRLIPWAPSIGRSIEDGEYQIAPLEADQKVVSIAENIPKSGTNVELNSYKGDYRHTFDVKYEGNGYYSIVNKYSGLSMDIYGGAGARKLGANIQLWERDKNSGAQKWMIKPCGDGYYQVISVCNGLYLDLQGGGTEDRNNISLWKGAEGNRCLKWKFIPYETPKLAPPTASIPSGSAVDAGAWIWLDGGIADFVYWTNDGTDPRVSETRTPGCKVTMVDLGKPLVIKAYAEKEGYQSSDVAEFVYDVKENTEPGKSKLNAPTASIQTNTEVEKGTEVSLSCGVNGVSIYYTLDGTSPTVESLLYYRPIVIERDTVITAYAVKEGWLDSDKTVFTYRLKDQDGSGRGDVLEEDVPQGKVENIPHGLWMSAVPSQVYTGKAIKPKVRVYDYKTLLEEKKDYTVSYKNNTKANAAAGTNTPAITVTGKGNYTGKETQAFVIRPKRLLDADVTADDITLQYNGRTQKPVPVVTWDGRKLSKNRDYTLSYPDEERDGAANPGAYTKEGVYTILMCGVGNYTGERKIRLTITKSRPASVMKVNKIADRVYTGEEVRPVLTVKDGGSVLREGEDYEVSYQNNVKVGTAFAVIAGRGTYTGTKRTAFQIVQKASLKQAQARLEFDNPLVYTGGQVKPAGYELTVSAKNADGNKEMVTLSEGTDFTVSYKNNIRPGTATVNFEGINGYTGTLKKTYRISPYKIGENAGNTEGTDEKIRVELAESYAYAKGGCKPEPVVSFQGKVLKKGTDYTLSYKNNRGLYDGNSAGKQPTVRVKGKDCFTGSCELPYQITAKGMDGLAMWAADRVWQNRGNIYQTKIEIRDVDGKALSAGRDYEKTLRYAYGADATLADGTIRRAGEEVSGTDILPAGTLLRVTAAAKGDHYTGEASCCYRITAADIGKATVKIPAQTYTGREIRPDGEIQVKLNRQVLSEDNYEITGYANNINKGTATVTIKGKNDCGGVKTVKFRIKGKGFLWWWK